MGFVHSYRADDPTRRKETTNFRRFKCSDLMAREKANLDIQWRQETMNVSNGETPSGTDEGYFE
jgi:hypothetical protein